MLLQLSIHELRVTGSEEIERESGDAASQNKLKIQKK
jgi:hypothetical protein